MQETHTEGQAPPDLAVTGMWTGTQGMKPSSLLFCLTILFLCPSKIKINKQKFQKDNTEVIVIWPDEGLPSNVQGNIIPNSAKLGVTQG